MFSLIISGQAASWETDSLMRMDVSRFGEHSDAAWTKACLDDEVMRKELESFPTLLFYESGLEGPGAKTVRYGYVRELRVVDQQIVFRFQEQGHFPRKLINSYSDRLGMGRSEGNRHHWAVKNGELPEQLTQHVRARKATARLTEVTRRELVELLLGRSVPFHGNLPLLDFLSRIWDLDSMPSEDHRFETASNDIWQHIINNADWDYEYLLVDRLDVLNVLDDVFLKLLEMTVHPVVGTPDEIAERVERINAVLEADGFRLSESGKMSTRPIFKAESITDEEKVSGHIYEIVLSFAGENREYVSKVAAFLKERGVSVFYDDYEEHTLWGKDLVEHLAEVYSKSARYCVMFISEHYEKKLWPNHERRSALERAVSERQEYILPARFDDTEIPGIRKTLGYTDLRKKTPEELGELILKKLGRAD